MDSEPVKAVRPKCSPGTEAAFSAAERITKKLQALGLDENGNEAGKTEKLGFWFRLEYYFPEGQLHAGVNVEWKIAPSKVDASRPNMQYAVAKLRGLLDHGTSPGLNEHPWRGPVRISHDGSVPHLVL